MSDVVPNKRWLSFCARVVEENDPSLRKRVRRDDAEGVLDAVNKFVDESSVRRVSAVERGHAIVDGIRHTLRVFDAKSGISRSPIQVEVSEMFLSAMAHIFYGDEYHNNLYAIMVRNRWKAKDMNGFCLVQAQRQLGKSTITALVVAAVLLNSPGVYGFVVATVFSQACIILDMVRKFIKKCFPMTKFKIDNEHEIILDFGNGDERRFEACADESRVSLLILSSALLLRISLRLEHGGAQFHCLHQLLNGFVLLQAQVSEINDVLPQRCGEFALRLELRDDVGHAHCEGDRGAADGARRVQEDPRREARGAHLVAARRPHAHGSNLRKARKALLRRGRRWSAGALPRGASRGGMGK
jgi:hypothetical protein